MNKSKKEEAATREEFDRVIKPLIDNIKPAIEYFRKEHKLSQQELTNLIFGPKTLIPLSIFSASLAPLRCIVKYLKEELNLKNNEISSYLKRDQKVIWKTYKEANKRQPKRFKIQEERYYIPISVFDSKELSILESLVLYLKENLKLSIKDISMILNKDLSTIYTSYNRANKKSKNE